MVIGRSIFSLLSLSFSPKHVWHHQASLHPDLSQCQSTAVPKGQRPEEEGVANGAFKIVPGSVVSTRVPWNYQIVSAIGRLYPLYSGAAQLALSRLFTRLATPRSMVAWCHGPGGDMIVPLDDFVGRCIYFTGDYDRKISWLCRRTVRPGDTVFDVGANMGVVTLLLARSVGAQGTVHAFEPNPRMASLLMQSAAMNRFTNINLHQFGLGSGEGMLELNIPRDNAGQGSLFYHKNKANCDAIKVRVRSLSDFVEERAIKRIRLIKIDVEGFEKEVLLGASAVLETVRPDLVLFEANETLGISFSSSPVVQILKKARYRLMAIPKCLLSMRVEPFEVELQNQSPSHDILAIAAEKYAEVLLQLSQP